MKRLLVALLLLSATAAHANEPKRDIFGVNLCQFVSGHYHLKRGDAGCPKTIETAISYYRNESFVIPELGLDASLSDDFVPTLGKGKLGGLRASVYQRLGTDVSCRELDLDCNGHVDISLATNLEWSDSCGALEVVSDKKYDQAGLWKANVVRQISMRCEYVR